MLPNYADTVKASVSMRDICETYGIHVDRAGFACCPFHGEKTASLRVYPGQRGYHCFGCHCGGDVLDFTQRYFGLDFPAALRKLNDDFQLGLPLDGQNDHESQKQARIAAAQRRRRLTERKKHHVALQKAYDEALAEFATVDALAEEALSQAALAAHIGLMAEWDKAISPEMVHAVTHIEAAWYNLCEAARNLQRFEHENYTERASLQEGGI